MDENDSPKPDTGAETGKGKPAAKMTKKTAVVGAAIGIGSAAIVAAMLYANRGNKS